MCVCACVRVCVGWWGFKGKAEGCRDEGRGGLRERQRGAGTREGGV